MSDLQNAIFTISDQDVVRKTSRVKQLVDILQIDVASIASSDDGERNSTNDTKTRKRYEVFVTGGLDANTYPVTSSLFQTVFDQDHTTQTSNELFDITIGCYYDSDLVLGALDTSQGLEDENNPGTYTGIDASGKRIFRNDVLMMREKINIYKQYAQYLLGNSEDYFTSPYESDFEHTGSNGLSYRERIDEPIFINIKRLFARDAIVKDEFVLRVLKDANSTTTGPNIGIKSDSSNEIIITDSNASSSLRITSQGGSVGTLKKTPVADGEDENVGLIFYEKGILILDAKRIFNTEQNISGSIDATSGTVGGTTVSFDSGSLTYSGSFMGESQSLWASGSIDDIVDHLCETRFGRSTATTMGFVNQTYVNSSIYVCRVAPSQANYSRNPTYTNSDGTIRVIEEKGDEPFAYITTVGLYDANNNLLAVAKTSRPIEKNTETDLSISVRIDY